MTTAMATQDLVGLGRQVLRYLHARELEQAARRLTEAKTEMARVDGDGRRRVVHELNRCIVQVRSTKEDLLKALSCLPATEAFDAAHRLRPLIQSLYDDELARLKAEKRACSLGRHRG